MSRISCDGLVLLLTLFVFVSFLFYSVELSKGRTRTTSNPNDLVTFDDEIGDIDDENVTTTSDIEANSTAFEPVIVDYTTQNFNKECLESHNELRKSTGVPPLKIDPKVSDSEYLTGQNLFQRFGFFVIRL